MLNGDLNRFLAFDATWYARAYPDAAEWARRERNSIDAEYHQRGARSGRSPNSNFDEAWYLEQYDDVRKAVASGSYRSGFHHYLSIGHREQRSPHAAFHEQWYLAMHRDVAAAVAGGNVCCGYEHYLSSGRNERRKAAPGSSEFALQPQYLPVLKDPPIHNVLSLEVNPTLASRPHLNVVLPSMQLRHMSGGPNTAINLLYRLAEKGIPIRFISGNTPIDSDENLVFEHMMTVSGVNRRLKNVSIVEGRNTEAPLQMGENDIFLATAWWTAQMIHHELGRMKVKPFLYLIQDFEPGLHAWSTDYTLALETYSMDIIPIFNTRLLRDYFVENRIGVFKDPRYSNRSMVFDPAIDRSLFYFVPKRADRRRRLLFYARPAIAQRNLFEIGLAALARAAANGVFSHESWELLYIGEQLPPTDLPRDLRIDPSPWLDFKSYAELMRSSDILLSLMLSPHPSYPPLEMASCGNVVVTNTFACKTKERLYEYSPNIIATEPYIAAVTEAIQLAVDAVRRGVNDATPESVLPATWDDAFATVMPELTSKWSELTTSTVTT
jgi:hypothetical protein